MTKTTMSGYLLAVIACGALAVTAAGCIPRKTGGGGGGAAPGGGAASPAADPGGDGKTCAPEVGLIDDAEDANNQVSAVKGRAGYWYTFLDTAGSTVTPQAGAQGGTFTMTAGGANGSQQAAHMSGKIGNGSVVFAGMGFNFVDPKAPYNASEYKGIAFYAKRGADSVGKIRLKVPDTNTDPDGKVCTECFNDFGADLELTTEWTKFVIPFSAMSQMSGWGAPRPGGILPDKIYGVQFQVNTPGASYDIWIDDVQFTGCP